jgi:uncharacterized protein YPO0396
MLKTDNFISKLRAIELKLISLEVDKFVKNQSLEYRQDFDKKRKEVSSRLKQLEDKDFEEILDRLESLKPEYKKAFDDLDREIESLNNAVKIVNSINAVTRVLAKVVTIF